MKRLLCAAVFALAILSPLAANEPNLTVLDFQTNNVSENDMKSIVTFLSASIFDTGKYTVIDTSQRDTILSELEFSLSGCSDESCQLEIGKLLSAEFIVTGDLAKVGSRYILTARMLETETSATVTTSKGIYASLDEMIDDMPDLALNLAGYEDAVPEDTAEIEELTEEEKASSEKTTPKPPREPMSGKEIAAWSCMGGGIIASGVGTYLFITALNYKTETVDPSYTAYMDETVTDYGGLTVAEYYENLWTIYDQNFKEFQGQFILSSAITAVGLASIGVSVYLFLNPQQVSPATDLSILLLPGPDSATLSFQLRY